MEVACPEKKAPQQAQKTVLVIDDEVHVRRVLELKLKNAGYRVIVATNGREGLQLVDTEKPDAVISDIMMPELDGQTFCKQTNGLKNERPFLTVVMTGRISPDEQKWIDSMHDTTFVEKPFSPSRLLERLDEYFGIAR